MLRVEEVEQASVERLNNCINIGGSPRTHAYTAERGGGLTLKLPSLTFNALVHFSAQLNIYFKFINRNHKLNAFLLFVFLFYLALLTLVSFLRDSFSLNVSSSIISTL